MCYAHRCAEFSARDSHGSLIGDGGHMTGTRSARCIGRLMALGAIFIWSAAAHAQISGGTLSTTGSTCTGANNADGSCLFSAAITANTGTTFSTRYAWNVNADVGAATTRDTSSNAQHNLSFSATA